MQVTDRGELVGWAWPCWLCFTGGATGIIRWALAGGAVLALRIGAC